MRDTIEVCPENLDGFLKQNLKTQDKCYLGKRLDNGNILVEIEYTETKV